MNAQSVDYTRRLYENVLGWYRTADTKAQVVLSMNGTFIAFVSGAAILKTTDLDALIKTLTVASRACLVLMALTLTTSILLCVGCLWCRLMPRKRFRAQILQSTRSDTDEPIAARHLWFFQFVSAANEKRFKRTIEGLTPQLEVETLLSQIHVLARFTELKHRLVDWAFITAAATLVLFVAGALDRVAFHASAA